MNRLDSPQPEIGIVPALDLDSIEDLRKVVGETSNVEGIVEYKLGLQAILHIGLFKAVEVVRELTDLPIIYDHQKAEQTCSQQFRDISTCRLILSIQLEEISKFFLHKQDVELISLLMQWLMLKQGKNQQLDVL